MQTVSVKWVVVVLLLVVGVVFADEEEFVHRVNTEVASVDTKVRERALYRATEIKDPSARRQVFLRLVVDPEPRIRCQVLSWTKYWAEGVEAAEVIARALDDEDGMVRETAVGAALRLRAEDLKALPLDRISIRLGAARDERERGRWLTLLARQIDVGIGVHISEILQSALDARSVDSCNESLACAVKATQIAALSSTDAPLLVRLLAREDTRAKTIGLLARARGPVAWKLLLEIEATSPDAAERERAGDALDRHEGRAKEYVSVLEEAAKDAKDSRVRDLARKRLAGDR